MANQLVTTTSKQFTLNIGDLWRGLIVAIITPVITIIMTSLNAGSLIFDWKAIGITALAAAVAYLVKNFLSPARIITQATPETVKAVKDGEATVKIINT